MDTRHYYEQAYRAFRILEKTGWDYDRFGNEDESFLAALLSVTPVVAHDAICAAQRSFMALRIPDATANFHSFLYNQWSPFAKSYHAKYPQRLSVREEWNRVK